MRKIVLIAHNIRSTHNVGSLMRTADGLGVDHVYFTGYTPFPSLPDDSRLPYIREKLDQQIHKTALGAENNVSYSYSEDILTLISKLKKDEFHVIGLEQDPKAQKLPNYKPPAQCALLLGSEVEGIDSELREECDELVEIPMYGQKESFNVVQASAIALYVLREA